MFLEKICFALWMLAKYFLKSYIGLLSYHLTNNGHLSMSSPKRTIYNFKNSFYSNFFFIYKAKYVIIGIWNWFSLRWCIFQGSSISDIITKGKHWGWAQLNYFYSFETINILDYKQPNQVSLIRFKSKSEILAISIFSIWESNDCIRGLMIFTACTYFNYYAAYYNLKHF